MSSAPDVLSTPAPVADDVVELERQYLLQNYSRYPLIVHRGKGCHVYDPNGARYLDFITGIGVNALGHAHPRIVKVIREQAALLIHSSNLYYHEYQGPLAKKLAETSGLQRTFFTNSGTEAMEGALKMIRSHGNHAGRRETRNHLPRKFVSWPHAGRALHHRAGQIPPGFRAAAAGRAVRSGQRCGGAGSRFQRIHGRHGAGDDSGRRRHLSHFARIPAQGARAGRPLQRAAGVRRDPMRRGPHRAIFRLSTQPPGGDAGRHGGRQTAGLRASAGRHRGQ